MEGTMIAMQLDAPGARLRRVERPLPVPGSGEIRVAVAACGVCRTDLHIVDGDIRGRLPIIPGHEIVGRVDATGAGVSRFRPGERVGIGWLARTCGQCSYCKDGRENLCDSPAFTGFTRDGDIAGQDFARRLGCQWAGSSAEAPPEPLDAAIIFAPVGALVPEALKRVRKGGRVICAGIHMSDIPAFPYADLWEERSILSVANLTRADGTGFLALASRHPVETHVTAFPLDQANEALALLRSGKAEGAIVLCP